MSAVTTTAAKLTIPPGVREFVRERGLEPYFPKLVEILEQLFADATNMSAEIHYDPEIEGLHWLLFDVEVPWDSYEPIRKAKDSWYDQVFAFCPPLLITEFSLSVWRR